MAGGMTYEEVMVEYEITRGYTGGSRLCSQDIGKCRNQGNKLTYHSVNYLLEVCWI